jgi:hypothetical protein
MTYLLRIEGWVNGEECPHAGQYVESFQHDTSDGRGSGAFTPDPRRAMQYATAGGAMNFWRQQSQTHPLRIDGLPNRPLTAATMMIVSMAEAMLLYDVSHGALQ